MLHELACVNYVVLGKSLSRFVHSLVTRLVCWYAVSKLAAEQQTLKIVVLRSIEVALPSNYARSVAALATQLKW